MTRCAIGFDFDHTLGIDNKLESAAFVQLAQRLAKSLGRPLNDERALMAIDREIGHYRAGRCTLDQAIALALEATLGEAAGPQNSVEEFRELAVNAAPQYVRPLPGVEDLLRALDASSIPYAILTNGWNPLQQRKAECIGFAKPVFVSDDLGVRKPSVHAFNVLRDYFALPADRIAYVGDDPRVDIVGSLNAGMKAIWFDWEHNKYPTDMPGPTAIIASIGDVLKHVE